MKKIVCFVLIFISISYSQEIIRFAWLSDIHIGYPTAEADLRSSVDDINNFEAIDFTIISGDITSMGSLEELTLAKQILDELDKPYYIIPGNHDTKWSESGGTDFAKLWGNDRFTFYAGKYLFIGMHQGPRMKMADGHFAPEDLRWFDSIIDSLSNSNQEIIFITHYPLDEGISNWYEMLDRLKNVNTQVALFGHGHSNRTYDFEGIHGIMGRSNLRAKNEKGGYNIVEIKSDSLFVKEKILEKNNLSRWHQAALQQRNFEQLIEEENRPDFDINSIYPNIKTVWSYSSDHTIASSPVIDEKNVFFGDASGTMYSLSFETGEELWSFKTDGPIFSTPEISNKLIVFGSCDSSIYCLNIGDGKMVWEFKTNAAVIGSPAISDEIVYIGGSDKTFRAIDLKSGKLIWKYDELNGFVESKPLVHEGNIMFGAWDEYFYCLNAENGKLNWKWKSDRNGKLYSPAAFWPVAKDEIAFVVAPDRQLTAVNISSGKELWRTGKYEVRETLGISECRTKIFIRTMNDTILALPVSDKLEEPSWITNCGFGYDISSAQIVEKDGILFFGTMKGMIFAINSESGVIQWQHKISNSFINTITPINSNSIVITNFDGKVIRLEQVEN